MSFARVLSAQPAIPHAHTITVEADITRGLHAFSVVGLPDKAVEEARDRVASAIKNSGFTSPKSSNKKIVISLAPAAIKKEGAVFDVPVALAYLLAAGDITFDARDKVFAGELALDGEIRPVPGILPIALAARKAGKRELFVPQENIREAQLVPGLSIFAVDTLKHLCEHLDAKHDFSFPLSETLTPSNLPATPQSGLEYIRGQEHAKRGLEIAAAGRHNIAFYGPPGTGKTMLARALTTLLPPLSPEEVIEVTTIHSVAGTLQDEVITHPPFRAPHHTASYASLIGGGAIPKPGEVTLAHRGVLFADEFPEFNRDVINALRQPLEEHVVSISRARGSAQFPAHFMLVAALNPCPCGHFGTTRCTCLPAHIERYHRKISGPIADRIDIWIPVGDISPESLRIQKEAPGSDETDAARARVQKARALQQERFSKENGATTNSDMSAQTLSLSLLSGDAEKTLEQAARTLHLSPRGYHRTIKVARTIADLAESREIGNDHMLEALQYRTRTEH